MGPWQWVLAILGGVGVVVTIIVTIPKLPAALKWIAEHLRWRSKSAGPGVRLLAENRKTSAVEDEWVKMDYVQKSGLEKRLAEEGYQVKWVAARKEPEAVKLKRWKVVVESLRDGRRVRYKVQDTPSIGGYLVFMKRRMDSPNSTPILLDGVEAEIMRCFGKLDKDGLTIKEIQRSVPKRSKLLIFEGLDKLKAKKLIVSRTDWRGASISKLTKVGRYYVINNQGD